MWNRKVRRREEEERGRGGVEDWGGGMRGKSGGRVRGEGGGEGGRRGDREAEGCKGALLSGG